MEGEVVGLGGKGEGIKKYKMSVIKQSQGYNVQHKQYSQ